MRSRDSRQPPNGGGSLPGVKMSPPAQNAKNVRAVLSAGATGAFNPL
jgi:hypothetical protein